MAVGEEFRTQFCIFTLSEKGQQTEKQKDDLWATVMISFHWDKISSWWLHPGSCTTGKGGKKDMHLLTWIPLRVLPKGAPHTVMFISWKNGDQLLNTVCWRVKWTAANTKQALKTLQSILITSLGRSLVSAHSVLRSKPYMNSDCDVTRRKSSSWIND